MLLKFMNRFEQNTNSYVQDSGIDLNQTQNVQDSGIDLNQTQNVQDSGIDLNQNQNLPSYTLPVQPSNLKSRKLPKANPVRSIQPSSMSLYSGSRQLRQVIVPNILIGKFLSIAQTNTSSNIETCGFLTGKRIENQFKITHLLIPKQSGTADSCDTNQEEIIFDYQEKHSLLTLGWIHTHPSQTAFLSSVDLHTQLSYQLMLPEAIAIVISPKYNETGFFSLTPDHGVDFIANCKENGFHPHPNEPPLFAEIEHMELDLESDIGIVDLRSI
jgi:STAM-binding protein